MLSNMKINKQLQSFEINTLFSTYNFFIIQDSLRLDTVKKYFLYPKIFIKHVLKSIFKVLLFSYFFDKKKLKFPIYIFFLGDINYFEFILLKFFAEDQYILSLKLDNCIFNFKNTIKDIFNEIFKKMVLVYSYNSDISELNFIDLY